MSRKPRPSRALGSARRCLPLSPSLEPAEPCASLPYSRLLLRLRGPAPLHARLRAPLRPGFGPAAPGPLFALRPAARRTSTMVGTVTSQRASSGARAVHGRGSWLLSLGLVLWPGIFSPFRPPKHFGEVIRERMGLCLTRREKAQGSIS